MKPESDIPDAVLTPQRRHLVVWLVPVLALIAAGWLALASWQQQGLALVVEFEQGHGLKIGDQLRYRGIAVGSVERVELRPDLAGIEVHLRVAHRAAELARDGSRFWVVRPELDLEGGRGLETVIGANYVTVIPGQGESRRRFIGLEDPPPLAAVEAGGLEVLLVAPGRGTLHAGAPITYREVLVGRILGVDLAVDGGAVEARAYIFPQYTTLVREHTRFWRLSAARLSAGWGGISLNVGSVKGLLLGAVTLATPPDGGRPALQHQRFALFDDADSDWLDWQPFVNLKERQQGRGTGPADGAPIYPPTVPAALKWVETDYWLFDREHERRGRLLPVGGVLIGPADLLQPPADALAQSAGLRLADRTLTRFTARPLGQGLARLEEVYLPALAQWDPARVGRLQQPEDLLVIAEPDAPARYLAASHIRVAGERWQVSPEVPFAPSWHGSVVVTSAGDVLVGLLLVADNGVSIARLGELPPEAVAAPVDAGEKTDAD